MTDHQKIIDALRERGGIEEDAAADLLELHDRTGLNLYQAPNLLTFVQEYAAPYAEGDDFKVQENGV
jgi:hypothetical protein